MLAWICHLCVGEAPSSANIYIDIIYVKLHF